jgi:hypothetical protein
MHRFATLLAVAFATSASAADPAASYTPQPVYCADGSGKLCPVVPSFIGPDPLIDNPSFGYQGLSNDVTSQEQDVQTPFDNMAWQMFVALNWSANGGADPKIALAGKAPAVWQTWSRPEDVFGGDVASCDNPKNLPRFDLISKSGDQHKDEGFQQATGQPLIDVKGNWTLFERHLNDVEKDYILSNGLDSLAGQQIFAQAGNTVALPIGDMSKTNGVVGAIEIKAAWRIIDAGQKDKYFSQQALLDVEGEYVADGKPLCQEVTLGLVGLHIIQNNGDHGNLLPQFIWASFEHEDNAPFAGNACDAADPNCYKTILKNQCPAAASESGSYSYWKAACRAAGVNQPPTPKLGQKTYLWDRSQPYAGHYTTQQDGTMCGTQATHCWQVYQLTQQLNTAWRGQLAGLGSVFRHYYLIGTNWGGNVEPDGSTLTNGSVPAFMGNATMETYIQANPQIGNCVGCHKGATLAYQGPDKKSYDADFSFLLGLATKTCTDVDAGPIFDNGQAPAACTKACGGVNLQWNGQWTTTQPGAMSVCGCCIATQ